MYSAQTVRLCKLEKIMYYDTPAVGNRQPIEQPCATIRSSSRFTQMYDVDTVGKQTMNKSGFTEKYFRPGDSNPKHFIS